MLYALIAVLAVLIFLLFLSLHIHVRYEAGLFSVYLRVLCFKYYLHSDAPRPLKKPKNKPKKAKKAIKKPATDAETAKEKKSLSDIKDTVDLILSVVSSLKGKFLSTLKITAARIVISVGSDNATKTALLYGAICQGVSYLMETLDNITRLSTVRDTEIHVGCDFSAEDTRAEAHLIFSMQVRHLLMHGLRALKAFIIAKIKKDSKNTKKDGNQK